jgi:hypothetical protein
MCNPPEEFIKKLNEAAHEDGCWIRFKQEDLGVRAAWFSESSPLENETHAAENPFPLEEIFKISPVLKYYDVKIEAHSPGVVHNFRTNMIKIHLPKDDKVFWVDADPEVVWAIIYNMT